MIVVVLQSVVVAEVGVFCCCFSFGGFFCMVIVGGNVGVGNSLKTAPAPLGHLADSISFANVCIQLSPALRAAVREDDIFSFVRQ